MNAKLSAWLKKRIGRRDPPSPLVRKIGKVVFYLDLLAVGVFVVWRTLLYFDVHSRFARLRASGFPVSGAELNVWPSRVPDAENGALIMTQAFALLRTFPDRRSNEVWKAYTAIRTNQWTPEVRALAEEYVQTNAAALAKAREALQFSRFRYPVNFSYGPFIDIPHPGLLIKLANIARLQATLDAEGGRTDEWPKWVEFQLNLADSLEGEPSISSQMARNAIIRTAAHATERSLSRATTTDEAFSALQASFERAAETNLMPFAMIGERARAIPQFRMTWKEIQNQSEPGELPQRYAGKPNPILWIMGFLERDLDLYLEVMEKSISLAALPPPQSLTLTNYLESEEKIAKKRFCIWSVLSLWSLENTAAPSASARALNEDAIAALAVERFRRVHGTLPDGLSELVPQFLDAVPTDPFDGAPLRYRRLDKGYVVYSIGADGHDDGGREPPEHRKSGDTNTYDITFIVDH